MCHETSFIAFHVYSHYSLGNFYWIPRQMCLITYLMDSAGKIHVDEIANDRIVHFVVHHHLLVSYQGLSPLAKS